MLTIRFQGPGSAVEKLKSSQDKIKAKVLAKLPKAKSAEVVLRDKPVNASSGSFYGGFVYGVDETGKRVKCGEVRIKTSSLGEGSPVKQPVVKEDKDLQEIKRAVSSSIHKVELRLSDNTVFGVRFLNEQTFSLEKEEDLFVCKKQGLYKVDVPSYIKPSQRKGYIPVLTDRFLKSLSENIKVIKVGNLSFQLTSYKVANNRTLTDEGWGVYEVRSTFILAYKIL